MIGNQPTIKDILLSYSSELSKVTETPELEIELLLSHVLGKEKEFLIKNPEYILSNKELEELVNFVNRGLKSEPISYILGTREFYGLNLKVNKDVLIPRPETEFLVEKALNVISSVVEKSNNNTLRIHELATGSGAIIISIAHELKKKGIENIELTASDISEKALTVARRNAVNILGKDQGIVFKKQDILEIEKVDTDILISNPPYISTEEIETLDKDVKDFEPRIALDGGKDGLKFYKRIFEIINNSRIPYSILEIHSTNTHGLLKEVQGIIPRYSFEVNKDYAQRDRILYLMAPGFHY